MDWPEDSSDWETRETSKANGVESKDNLNCTDRVTVSATHDEMVTLEASEAKISVQEVE